VYGHRAKSVGLEGTKKNPTSLWGLRDESITMAVKPFALRPFARLTDVLVSRQVQAPTPYTYPYPVSASLVEFYRSSSYNRAHRVH
jgi:hypothetical protein